MVVAAAAAASTSPSFADVTVQEQATFDFAMIKAHVDTTDFVTDDKERRDTTMRCDGLVSLLCGHNTSGDIVRLDRNVEWRLEPKRQEYRETPFLTPAQRLAAEREARANLAKLKQCPAPKRVAPGPDTDNCQMSPPRFDLERMDAHTTIIGHDARLTRLKMTQTCSNPRTGDSCDFQISMDSWLTQERIPGLEDRRAFMKAYLRKLGLSESDQLVQADMRKFLAPYAESLKALGGRAGTFQGVPLKTSVRILFGGPQCSSSRQGQDSDGGGARPWTSVNSAAADIGGKLIGGLFKRKPAADADAAAAPSPVPPGMVQAAVFTSETTAITAAPISPAQFEIPAGWKLVVPPTSKAKDATCPSAG